MKKDRGYWLDGFYTMMVSGEGCVYYNVLFYLRMIFQKNSADERVDVQLDIGMLCMG